MKTAWVLILIYQSFMTNGITSQTVYFFETKSQCLEAAQSLDNYDKKDCVQVSR